MTAHTASKLSIGSLVNHAADTGTFEFEGILHTIWFDDTTYATDADIEARLVNSSKSMLTSFSFLHYTLWMVLEYLSRPKDL